MPVKGGYLLLAGAGGLLLYSGVKGKSFSSAFRNLLSGKAPSTAANANTLTSTSANAAAIASTGAVTAPQEEGSTGSAKANQLRAKALLLVQHPTWAVGQQWQALVDLWNQESSWNQYAYNPS